MGLSIGGDGTLLGVSRRLGWSPVCGINVGSLGFMAEIEPEELEKRLEQILRGEYRVERRLLLRGSIRLGKAREIGEAINDIVITKVGISRMVHLELRINGTALMSYKADGIIISSATGSTAYSLSAGGPIMNPQIRALLITPICAHSFQLRSLIVNESDEVGIIVHEPEEVEVTLDGQVSHKMFRGEELVVRRAEKSAEIVRFEDRNYYDVLKAKILRR